jgi:hypothetical protein
MSRRGSPGMLQTKAARFSIAKEISAGSIPNVAANDRHRFFGGVWYVVSILLILAILLVAYSAAWEYSTRAYLRGFSDAIVPATAPPDEKIQAILDWMAHGPARMKSDPPGFAPNRDPTDTLNYDALLRVCGSATNAFLNLVNSGGLAARRLLLLDSNRMTKHVVAEVLVSGRWVVVDPAYRVILRGPDGNPVTREELAVPAILAAATRDIRGYDPIYTFDRTAHIRLARLHIMSTPLRLVIDRLWPQWQNSPMVTLLVERESLAAVVGSITAVFLLILLRGSLRWYGERRLGICRMRVRAQLVRAYHVFFNISDQSTT